MAEQKARRQEEEINMLKEALQEERKRNDALEESKKKIEKDMKEEVKVNEETSYEIDQLQDKYKTLEEKHQILLKSIGEEKNRNKLLIKQKEEVEKLVEKEEKQNRDNVTHYNRLEKKRQTLKDRNTMLLQKHKEERNDAYARYCKDKERKQRIQKQKGKRNT